MCPGAFPYVWRNKLWSVKGLRTADDVQADGAAGGARRVAGPAHVLPRHPLGQVAEPQGALPLVWRSSAQ